MNSNNVPRISAVVPAYNEEALLGGVLDVLVEVPSISEIIVIDDGSSDNTTEVARLYSNVRVLVNGTNKGKAYSMDRGVAEASSDIIFFCDADLRELKSGIVEEIIEPVAKKEVDMCIGIRDNRMQKAINLFAINSGERALRKSLWNNLPSFFKYRFRIEAGLNYYAKHHGRGFKSKKFIYYQTIKEKKYGIASGVAYRCRMYYDVGIAYTAAILHRLGIIKLGT